MSFELPDLPYAYDALAQNGMCSETLEFHHDLHHKAYVDNGSQHWNHIQFWEMMGPDGRKMPGELESAITASFGSIDEFKAQFVAAGVGQFGSGWCWLVQDASGSLAITKTENGVNPLCFGQTALLGCDVWEHSYYIDFRNKRPVYIQNFLDNLVNWENVAARMAG
jgi:Fe-Mn family superoxide dismutase